jgi:hypothetical protein
MINNKFNNILGKNRGQHFLEEQEAPTSLHLFYCKRPCYQDLNIEKYEIINCYRFAIHQIHWI